MKTADEIIRALENCSNGKSDCADCPYRSINDCVDASGKDALNLIRSLMAYPEYSQNAAETQEPWTREKILAEAEKCVCGQREQDYGGPESSFLTIANLWTVYHGAEFTPVDVAVMLALLKVARLASNSKHMDSWVDLAGYAACGGEIAGKEA